MERSGKILAILICSMLLTLSLPRSSHAGRHAQLRDGATRERQPAVVTQLQVERLERIMLPLVRATDHRRRLNEIEVKVIDDRRVNAASGGNGQFFVTSGLLQRANDAQLRGVLAHEIAHDDLGHPARAQLIGTGVGLGVMLLERLIPGSSGLTPVAGELIARGYSRPQEYAADRHAVEILRRAGYPQETMANALLWLMKNEGDSGGGFLSTHPATSDRIHALRALR